jgi:hypothetical protein
VHAVITTLQAADMEQFVLKINIAELQAASLAYPQPVPEHEQQQAVVSLWIARGSLSSS